MYDAVNPELFPFISTLEFKNYFEGEFKQKMADLNSTRFQNKTFENLGLDLNIVKSLISNGPKGLLDSQNAVDFLFYNYTRNLYDSYLKFNIQTLDQLFFLSDYFVNFLPNLIYYPSFNFDENFIEKALGKNKELKDEKSKNLMIKNLKEKIMYGNKQSNALVSLIPMVLNNSIMKIKENLKQTLIANVAFYKLKSEQNLINCNNIFLNVTKSNQERTDKICANHLINLDNYESIKRWVYISDCVFSNCKEEEKKEIQEISGLSEVGIFSLEISLFFTKKLFSFLKNFFIKYLKSFFIERTFRLLQLSEFRQIHQYRNSNNPKGFQNQRSRSFGKIKSSIFQFRNNLQRTTIHAREKKHNLK